MSDARTNSAFNGAQQLLEPGMVDQIRLSWRLLRDPRVCWVKNVLPAVAALYVLSPIDLAPDFLPGIGQIDDAGLVVALLLVTVRLLPRLAPAWVVDEHLRDIRGGAPEPTSDGRHDRSTAASGSDGRIVEGQYRVRK